MTMSNDKHGLNRRQLLAGGLLSAVGLRALATGLPAAFLSRPGSAAADAACADANGAQFLILSISQNGDPINANAPGCYEDAGVIHAATPEMAATTIKLGAGSVKGAQAWSTLPQAVLDRTCFFHGTTQTTIHPDLPKVIALMGAGAAGEMLPSIYAQYLAGCLGTVQAAPVSVVGTTAAEFVSYKGRNLPNLNAQALRDILSHPAGPLTNLIKLRDQSMDKLHARLKQSGTAQQRAFMDNLAQSRAESRDISEQLLSNLAAITANDANGQMLAAAALIKMNITPVVVMRIPFGGDNHADPLLAKESAETVSGVATIAALQAKLTEFGLQDRVTFMTLHTFGRTLKQLGTAGRNHWADHHVSVVIGKGVKPGVVGGVIAAPQKGDYTALSIDAASGKGLQSGGDIAPGDTLGALGKTVGRALGIPQAFLDQNISKGKTVTGALV